MRRQLILVALLAAAAGACSRPTPPSLFVSTVPPGASCTVGRLGQPVAVIDETPGIALIEPADRELTVHCRRHAFDDAEATVAVHPVGERFDFAVAGRPRTEFPGTVTLVMTPKPAGALR